MGFDRERRKLSGRLVSGFWTVFCLLLVLCAWTGSATAATTIADYGDITVMEYDGVYDADIDNETTAIPRREIANQFYATHPDEYDFLLIFTNFQFNMPASEVLAFYHPVKNDVSGIGIELFDNTSIYGSNGGLQGTIDMGDLADIESDPMAADFTTTMTILSHELLHRWAAHVTFLDGGSPSGALLGKDGSHWSYLLDTDASVLYGNDWQDNGDGSFTSGSTPMRYFSELDLYLMGLADAAEVSPMLLIDNSGVDATGLPEADVTITGTALTVTIDDIIAAEGARDPAFADAQKRFKIGCILLTRTGTFTGEELYPIRRIVEHWETWFSSQTNGRGAVTIGSAPSAAIPVNPGVDDPAFTPRTSAPQISEGVAWLAANQLGDGSWADNVGTVSRDTCAAINAMVPFTGVDANLADGASWFIGQDAAATDALTQKINALTAYGTDASATVITLQSLQNTDGGWGAGAGYTSNSDDTALALNALGRYGATDPLAVGPAVGYLLGNQNTDGGWGYGSGQSALRPTLNTLAAFAAYRGSYALETAITNGLAWVATAQRSDGGVGEPESTVADTAHLLIALKDLTVDAALTNGALDYLLDRQQLDGSWNQRSSDTALAVGAVFAALQAPELSIDAEDIVLTPETPTSLPVSLTVDALVVNNGFTDVSTVDVGLYDGPVAPVNLLAVQTIAVSGQSSQTVTFNVSFTDGGSRRLYIAVDADNSVTEPNEGNNMAYREVCPQITYTGTVPDPLAFDAVGEGGASDDTIAGTAGSDLLNGLAGDDDLAGGDGADWLIGGEDNDSLAGGSGDDVYYFEPGFGQDQIVNGDGGFDGIVFGGGIIVDDLAVRQSGDDLVIRIRCTTDQITILGWYLDDANTMGYVQPVGGYGITAIEMEQMAAASLATENPAVPDESTFDQVVQHVATETHLTGTEGNDLLLGGDTGETVYVHGYGGDDWLVGGADFELMWSGDGNDVLIGGDGEDQLNGEAGDDILYGGAGFDRYVYESGGGRDEIHNQGNSTDSDRLFFLDGVTADQLYFYRYCDNLVIRVDDDDTRQVTVVDWFVDPDYEIAYIQTDDDVLNATEVNALVVSGDEADAWTIPDETTFDTTVYGAGSADTLAGSLGADLVRGYEGDDTLDGLAGDDWLVGDGGNDIMAGGDGTDTLLGGAGNDELAGDGGNDRLRGGDGDDTYLYAPGDGADEIHNLDSGSDILTFSGGITTDRLGFLQEGQNLIVRVDDDPTTQVTIIDWFEGSPYALAQVVPDGGPALTTDEINQMFASLPDDDEDFTVPEASSFDSVVTGTSAGEQLVGTNGDDLIEGLEGDDELHGFDGADWLIGGDGVDYIDGYAGDDTQIGGAGNDQLEGSAGNDRLKGGTGDDKYVFRPGFGADRIYNGDGGTDWIIFTDDLNEDRLDFYRLDLDLIIRVDDREDLQVTVRRWFEGGEYEVDYLQPADSAYGIPAATINTRVVLLGTPGDTDADDDVDGKDLATLAGKIAGGDADATDLATLATTFGQP